MALADSAPLQRLFRHFASAGLCKEIICWSLLSSVNEPVIFFQQRGMTVQELERGFHGMSLDHGQVSSIIV